MALVSIVSASAVAAAAAASSTATAARPTGTFGRYFSHPIPVHSPGMSVQCAELYFDQKMDHFSSPPSPGTGTFRQRYFLNDRHYIPGGPMFFYLGNEADVTLYVNATGLMWENAAEFGALIVFAEHRYYGKSRLFPPDDDDEDPTPANLRYLSVEQALMDYVALIDHLKEEYRFAPDDAVIGFGGSYGGMLASWGRFAYPHVWDGAVAASAPIVTFEGMEEFMDPYSYAEGTTYDVTPSAGASEMCEKNLRKAFAFGGLLNETAVPPSLLRTTLRLCEDDNTTDADLGRSARDWINDALSYMAMGNYPYPSSYILNGAGALPAFPVRVACESLVEDLTGDDRIEEWLAGLASFAGVYYNYTGRLACNRLSAPVNKESRLVNALWNYQYCSQIFQVFGQRTDPGDMYWDDPWDGDRAAGGCLDEYGFYPDRRHFAVSYGTPADWARDASNIVWSQGEYDPWRGGGLDEDLSDSLVAVVIAEAAHHLDLFFSHEDDTDAVVAARKLEMDHVARWIAEKRAGSFKNQVAKQK